MVPTGVMIPKQPNLKGQPYLSSVSPRLSPSGSWLRHQELSLCTTGCCDRDTVTWTRDRDRDGFVICQLLIHCQRFELLILALFTLAQVYTTLGDMVFAFILDVTDAFCVPRAFVVTDYILAARFV